LKKNIILEIKNLTTSYHLINHTFKAVDNISFHLYENEILAIAGESGCGKSVTTLSILNLIEKPGIISINSEILFDKKNILYLNEKEISKIRGNKIAMIFQEPSASFNLLLKIGYQISETLKIHKGMDKNQAAREACSLLESVNIPEAKVRVNDYPFQMSGGMLQRTMIAMALSCSPQILLADEPTTALDVTIQAQILKLLKEKQVINKMSIILVTHDLEVINGFADRVIIMYAGRILEKAYTKQLFNTPLHPYTKDLLNAIPRLGYFKDEKKLYTIKGTVPEPFNLPSGCKYWTRCTQHFDKCKKFEPPFFNIKEHLVRCWLFDEKKEDSNG
jgi:oligopeptide/dipeptide ABC transporter ATP-binding protein